jgi:ABC-type nickel/cobalt efflux system permease component RcnA
VKLFGAVLAAVAALLAAPAVASAHPLGNFTVNRYAGIQLAGDRVYVHYVLDLAEVSTFQLGDEVRARSFPTRLARDLELELDGSAVVLRPLDRRVTSRPGAGGLETLRLDVLYGGELSSAGDLAFEDHAFVNRIGWREVTIAARDGARLDRASVPARSVSDELRAYPPDLLRSALDVSTASATVVPGSSAGAPPSLGTASRATHEGGGFESLVRRGDSSPGVVLISLLVAMFWGAAHALTPGHGKALVAAYLVGTRGRPRHAFLLGGTVAAAHTAGVFALGLVTLALTQILVPEQLYPWLTLASGLLVVVVGASVLRARLGLPHGHNHGHPHEHGHEHGPRGILGVGVAAGALPCPSALVVLLGAIALHRVGLGLALIVAFSIGLAATITAIGLVAVLARRAFGRMSLEGPLVRALPAASAALILVVGIVLTARALPRVV